MTTPEGWKLVPVEPTAEMMSAAWDHAPADMDDMDDGYFGRAYQDMLEAAPTPPAKLSTVVGLDFDQPLETHAGEPVKWITSDVIEYRGARVCVDVNTGIVYSSPYVGLQIRNVVPIAPPAQEAEPVASLYVGRFRNFTYLGNLPDGTYKLYTHAPSDKLRQAAEWAVKEYQTAGGLTGLAMENLRKTLEGK